MKNIDVYDPETSDPLVRAAEFMMNAPHVPTDEVVVYTRDDDDSAEFTPAHPDYVERIECDPGPFVGDLEEIAAEINRIATDKGFWDTDRNDGEMIALMHSELSEALEAIRHGNPSSEKIPAFSSVEEEFADLVIRVLDTCHARHYHLGEAILAKIEYNRGRPRKHGKAF